MWVDIESSDSNQVPRFLAEGNVETLQSPTRMLPILILANCLGVPIMPKNSDLYRSA